MNKRTKAVSIPQKVKKAVWERDNHCCVYCGSPYANPEAHYIPRSKGGLGVERNILTLCRSCHNRYDHTDDRREMATFFREYLKCCYADWDEKTLTYGGKKRCLTKSF